MESNKDIQQRYPLVDHYRRNRRQSNGDNRPVHEDNPASPGSFVQKHREGPTQSTGTSQTRNSHKHKMSYREYQSIN